MSVAGRDYAEGDLVTAIRGAIGAAPLISAAMDLHGNVSRLLFDACDLMTCYRTAPHVDVWETRERAAHNLVDALRSGARPHKALVHVPILLPGEQTSTREEPARGLYARIPAIEARAEIIDAAIWIGSPVRGWTPWRALRCERWNLPKPENTTSLSRLRVSSMISRTASTASAASFLPRFVLLAT